MNRGRRGTRASAATADRPWSSPGRCRPRRRRWRRRRRTGQAAGRARGRAAGPSCARGRRGAARSRRRGCRTGGCRSRSGGASRPRPLRRSAAAARRSAGSRGAWLRQGPAVILLVADQGQLVALAGQREAHPLGAAGIEEARRRDRQQLLHREIAQMETPGDLAAHRKRWDSATSTTNSTFQVIPAQRLLG